MKDSQWKKYHNGKHIYLETESNKKLIAEIKFIIKHNQKNNRLQNQKNMEQLCQKAKFAT